MLWLSFRESDDEVNWVKYIFPKLSTDEIQLIDCIFPPRKVTFEKQWFYLDNVIGHSYGTTFEVTNGGSLQPKKKKEEPTSGALFYVGWMK